MDDDFDMVAPGGEMMDDFDLPDNDGPVLNVGEEKEIGKLGLKKKLLKEGQSWETPKSGDEVEDGTQFDSSRNRGTPFKFTLGQGSILCHRSLQGKSST